MTNSLFFTLAGSRIAESFGERVVIDFQLRDLEIHNQKLKNHFLFGSRAT